MSIATPAPVTIEIRRSHLIWLVTAVAALVAACTFVVATRASSSTAGSARSNITTRESVLASLTPEARKYVEAVSALPLLQLAATYGGTNRVDGLGLTPIERAYVDGILALTPRALAATFGNTFAEQP